MLEIFAIAVILFAIVLLGWHMHKPPGTYELRKLDRPPQYMLLGHVPYFLRDICEVTTFLLKLFATYKSPVAVKILHKYIVVLYKAEQVEIVLKSIENIRKSSDYRLLKPWLADGILLSSGHKWHHRRRLLTPTFHYQILKEYIPIFNDKALVLVDVLQEQILKSQGNPINVTPLLSSCTLDIICETAMGKKLGSLTDAECEHHKDINEFAEFFMYRIMKPWLRPEWLWNMTAKGKRCKQVTENIHAFARDIIKEREEEMQSKVNNGYTTPKRKAFLDLLLEMKAEGKLNAEDVQEEVDNFMLAGHETTAIALMWALYCLGQYRDIQEQLHDEIVTNCGTEGPVVPETFATMPLLDRVLKEAQRLYPTVPFIGRTLVHPIEIDGTTIPAGTKINLNILGLHRDGNQFPEPEKFDPDRFLPENVEKRHPFAFVPFSAGPRNCLGQKFGALEDKVIMVHLMRAFKFEAVQDPKTMRIASVLTLRPFDGVHLKIEPRK